MLSADSLGVHILPHLFYLLYLQICISFPELCTSKLEIFLSFTQTTSMSISCSVAKTTGYFSKPKKINVDMTLEFNLNILKFYSLSQLCPLQLLKLYYFFLKNEIFLRVKGGTNKS